ncbi:MAG: alpha/beta fold hydrolase [Xanthomonadales bacterium]|nr:alpha/beta fold hydrolase [Xanthomonadales bacterium]
MSKRKPRRSASTAPTPAPAHAHLRAPGWRELALEARAPWEFAGGLLSWWMAHRLPRGDGQPVVVFPGLAASDTSTLLLRQVLKRLGYVPYGWGQGFNAGPRHGVLKNCIERIEDIHVRHGRSVSLVGWSLGGLYAREMAKLAPEQVRQVITMGSPFAGHPRATNAWPLFRLLSGHHEVDPHLQARLREPPPRPTTSIFSRSDGVVAWQCSVQEAEHPHQNENVELSASHFGMGFNPMVLYVIADRLAQGENAWRPFEREGLRRLFYPEPVNG